MEDILPSSLNKIAIYTSNNLTNSITNITQQLNTVPNKITGTFENALDNDLTPNKILLTNSTGKLIESSGTVTSTDLEYLKGLTSPIKTQLTNTSNYAKTVSDGTIANLNGVNTQFNLEGAEVILPFIKDNSTTSPQPIQINDTDYYYAFTSTSGTNFITFDEATVCDVLVVGGGGSGTTSAGGGAGGLVYEKGITLNAGTYTITVGIGGTAPGWSTIGNNGGNSKITSPSLVEIYTAVGGGGGAYSNQGKSGGSGGGNGYNGSTTGGTGTSIQGFAGGGVNYVSSATYAGGGGGGAGGVGGNATSSTVGGNGGLGREIDITGVMVGYAGGGAGAARGTGTVGTLPTTSWGGSFGGGSGNITSRGGNGTPNTGGGGGGGGVTSGTGGGDGGSGIVIIRWKVGEPKFIPEAVAMSNGNIIEHKPVSGSDEYVYVEFTEESIKYPTTTSITWYSSVLYGGVGSGYNPSQLFNNTTGGIGTHWPENYYNHTTGYFDPGYSGTIAAGQEYNPSEYRSDYLGCWFSFDNNKSIILGSVRCYPRGGYSKRLPKEFRIYGTNDANIFNNGSQDISNNSWEMIAECKNTSYFSSVPDGLDFAVENKYNKSFRYYLIIVNRIFANNSALNFTELELYVKQSITFEKSTNIDYIVVGAGGSGGYAGGGAGGGDVIAGNITLSKGQYNIVVAETTSKSSSNGGNHSSISSLLEHFDTIWGCGGKGGSSYNARGSYRSSPSSTSAGGGAGNGLYGDSLNGRESLNNLSGYGGKLHNDGSNSLVHSGGGGGSLTTPYGDGQDGTAIKSGDGGSGTQTFIRGIEEYFGGGGGGAVHYTGHGIEAIGLGKHGGGNGGVTTSTGISAVAATHGQANTGGGGGGGANYGQLWGYGGSGIVIIRWKKQAPSEISTFSNKLLEDLSAVTLDKINTNNSAKIIQNNTYSGDLAINGKLTVSNNMLISGVTADLFSTSFTQESLEISALTTDSLLNVKQSGSGNILELKSGGVSKVTITNNGNIGIGKTNPSTILDVAGNVKATSYYINGSQLSYNHIANKPTVFNPASHTHPISDITNLQTSLDNKQPNIPVMSYNSGTNTITIDADVVLTANKKYQINGTDILQNANYVTGTSGGASTTVNTIEDTYWKQRPLSMPLILNNSSNVSAKQINSHTYYYDFTNVCKYPRENMSAASKTYADGTVVQAKASTQFNNTDESPWSVFDGSNGGKGWASAATYSGGSTNANYVTGYTGEWIMIDLGESIKLSHIKIYPRDAALNRFPKTFRLYASTKATSYTNGVNDIDWINILEYNDAINTTKSSESVTIYITSSNQNVYRYYFMVINKTYGGDDRCQFAEMEFYAKRHSITFSKDTYCDVLLIGGGGSGGCGQSGAGGGAGECRYIQNHLFTSGTYNIIVGKGGISKTTNTGFGYKGDDSYIVKDGDTEDFLRAYGGGAGGQGTLTDTSTIVGGSSGGVGTTITVYSPDPSGNMQGLANKGGTGINNLGGFYAGGGGGGAGSAGGNALYFTNPASMCYAGQGGYGVKLDITGEYKYYAAGGGGSISSGNFTSKTVLGIGGATNQSGVDGTGSGGGGTSSSSGTSGKGGNGIVIIRWNSFENENHILYNNIELYNNNVIIENQKYFNDYIKYGDIQKYPPGPMTANTTTLSGYSYGNGTYIVSASSAHNIATAGDVWNLFDSNSSSFNFPNTRYNITTGSSNANTATLEGTFYVGEWIKIQMPQQIYLHHIKFIPRTSGEGLLSRSPNIYRIYASNDGSRWKMLLNNTTTAIYHTEKESCYHNTEIPYLQNNDKYFYFAICVNSLYGGDIYSDYFNIIEIEIYGSESFVNSKNSNNVASLQKSIVVGEGNVLLYNGNIQANTMNANHCTVKEQLNINKCITPYQKYPILHNHTLSNPANLEYKFTYSDGTPEFKFKVSSQYNSNTGYHNWSIDKSFDGIFNGSITNWTITGWTTPNSTYSSGNAANTYKTGYAGEWLIYDIGVSKTLKQVKIYPYNIANNLIAGINRQPKSFRIYASNTASAYSDINDASWLQIYEGYNTNSDEYVKTYNITNNINYRYYSIVFNQKVNSTDGDTNISINELEFYYEIKDDINNYVERYPKMYNDLYLVRSTDTDIASNKTISSYVSSKAYKYTYSNSLNRYPTFRFQCSNYRTDWSTGLPCFYCFDEYLQHADNTTVETNRNYGWNTPAYYTNQVTINSVIYRHYAGSTEHISGYKGEWIMFDMGIPKNLKKFVFGVDSNNTSRQPGEFRLYGSNHLNAYRAFNTYPGTFTSVGSNTYKVGEGDNDGWEKLYDGYNTVNNNVKKSYDLYNNIKYYQYYLIIVNKTLQGDSYLSISEIELYTALDMITTSWNIEGDIVNDLTFTLTNKYNEKNIICEFDGSKTNTGQYTNFTGVHHCKSENKELYSKKYIGYIVSSQNKYQKMNSMYSPENIQRNMDNEEWDYLPIVDLSRKQNDKNSFGVICKIEDDNSTKRYINTGHLTHYYDKKEYDRRLHIAGVGEGGIWICDCNGQLEAGDYITTSHIPGIGMKQTDDIQHNYTVAKITMDCDFYPQQIPLKKLNDEGVYENIYDNDGNIVYEKQYDIKYIKESGEIIDDINAYYMSTLYDSVETPEKIYKIAFVGCSYNCS